jgi:hypothetical protein
MLEDFREFMYFIVSPQVRAVISATLVFITSAPACQCERGWHSGCVMLVLCDPGTAWDGRSGTWSPTLCL